MKTIEIKFDDEEKCISNNKYVCHERMQQIGAQKLIFSIKIN